jgi:hypothetical protein
MGIDVLNEDKGIQLALADVDDGSALDGNARVDNDDEDDDEDFFEGHEAARPHGILNEADRRGDGALDMKDLRAFRDALIQVLAEAGTLPFPSVDPDGAVTHFKRDLNFDGCVGELLAQPAHPDGTVPADPAFFPDVDCSIAPREAIHPRYDLNGDGEIRPEGRHVDTEPLGVAPFKIDPDTACVGLNDPAGCVRDVDVLADEDLWDLDAEQVSLDPADEGFGACGGPPGPLVWLPKHHLLADRDGDQVIDYLHSADFHFVLGADPTSDVALVELQVFARGSGWSKCVVIPNPRVGRDKRIVTVPLFGDRQVRVSIRGLDASFQPVGGFDPYAFSQEFEGVRFAEDCVIRLPGPIVAIADLDFDTGVVGECGRGGVIIDADVQ